MMHSLFSLLSVCFKSYYIVEQSVELRRNDLVDMTFSEEPLAVYTVSKKLFEKSVSLEMVVYIKIKTFL